MAAKTITVSIDEELKRQADEFFGCIGLDLASAFSLFAKQAVNRGKIISEIALDPFYSPSNQKRLKKAVDNLNAGKIVTKTMEELEAMENE